MLLNILGRPVPHRGKEEKKINSISPKGGEVEAGNSNFNRLDSVRRMEEAESWKTVLTQCHAREPPTLPTAHNQLSLNI